MADPRSQPAKTLLLPMIEEQLRVARDKCGPIIAVTVEALGYRIVPAGILDTFLRHIAKGDEA